jgi:hypothetical protein
MINLTNLTWHCEICGKERPDAYISVHKVDMSHRFGLTPGTVYRNIRYCNDNKECIDGAVKKGEEEAWKIEKH